MAMKLEIKQKSDNPNIVVMGQPMSGKTWWVSEQMEKEHLVISTDDNAREGSQIARVYNWDDLIEARNFALGDHPKSTEDKFKDISIDLLDDVYAFAEARAMKKLGMTHKADNKGSYGKLAQTVDELLREDFLRPILMSDKRVFVVMHTAEAKDGTEQPCFGSFSSEAIKTLNWLIGRSKKVVLCSQYAGIYEANVLSERNTEAPKEEPKEEVSEPEAAEDKATDEKAPAKKTKEKE